MRWGLLHGAALAVAAACQGGGYFVCNDDDDCAGQGVGICQPTGACSFPDGECPSGQRYGESSQPSLAGECVAMGDGSTGAPEDPSTSSGAPQQSSSEGPHADVTGEVCPPDWWDCAWAHRQPLSLRGDIGETLTEVPVLVLLVSGRVDHELMQADGEDLRFVSSAGTELPYEIERWDPTGVSTLWVVVDVLGGARDHVWLYYGNPAAEGAEDPGGVWPEPHVAVWHLEGDPLDSTAHQHHAASSGSTALAEGHIANGRNIIGSSGRLDVDATDGLVDLFAGGGTVSAWIRARSFGGSGYGRIADKEDGDAETGWLLYAASGGRLRFHTWFVGSNLMWETPGDAIALHRWIHVAVTFDALGPELPRVFVDGEEVELDAPPDVPARGELPTDADVPLALGNRPANDRRFDGILDEIRMERAIRSPAWIRVQHDTMRDALFEYGPIESWGGGA